MINKLVGSGVRKPFTVPEISAEQSAQNTGE